MQRSPPLSSLSLPMMQTRLKISRAYFEQYQKYTNRVLFSRILLCQNISETDGEFLSNLFWKAPLRSGTITMLEQNGAAQKGTICPPPHSGMQIPRKIHGSSSIVGGKVSLCLTPQISGLPPSAQCAWLLGRGGRMGRHATKWIGSRLINWAPAAKATENCRLYS